MLINCAACSCQTNIKGIYRREDWFTYLCDDFILHIYVAAKLTMGRNAGNDSLIFNRSNMFIKIYIIICINIDRKCYIYK